MNARALANILVREDGRTVAMLFVHDREPRKWGEETQVFLRMSNQSSQEPVCRFRTT